ncbi:MAG: gamma-glutamyl-gamma-aminobutyrate hydrolase family protein [Psychromonas sp.]|nr:gamma-glutamyl-gamma-aminobutyrate hydrolase family protein [Psychromonas sp.]
MKPIIGITSATQWEKNREFSKASHYYADSVLLAGGLPVYLPIILDPELAEHYLCKLDGLLLSGGDEDVQPHHYGEGPLRGLNNVSPDRDLWEFALIKAAIRQNKPILGICRGCQILNVAFGGNLYQSLRLQYPGTGEHYPRKTEMHHLYHSVKIATDSLLYKLFGEKLMVNSFHNMALKDIAPCFKVTARSSEGVIEGVESQEHPFVVGVQWHPEALTKHHPHFVELFKAHISACNAHRLSCCKSK